MKSMSCELVSTRIKHTRKNNQQEKSQKLFIQLTGVCFQRDQTKCGLTCIGSGLLRISFEADGKNKNQFLFMQALKQLFES